MALAYGGRGHAWAAKKDFDRAIASDDEAIRLDPGFALAYQNRGNARDRKGEYDIGPSPTTTRPSGSPRGTRSPSP